ncbi:glycosyltransferase family 2 protein [Planococcus beigongshangi]|uniref:glycosyltransferase family 2 protein n=1 Tax=Planococcus beigongshangi TaxID=2782536 RepID=UPI00193C7F9B|nr:glycosyltransferase family 2 protein [Planococcus beigongshangi]
MQISIIIPCYNEENNIHKFQLEMQQVIDQSFSYELIFVNDGSQDNTENILRELAKKDDKLYYISLSRNFGKEAAMLAGLEFAKGDAVIIMDGDLQHPPSLIPQMIGKFEEGYDQVIAKRNRKGDSLMRSGLSSLYYRLINWFVEVELENGVGDFRLLSRRAVNSLLSMNEYNRFSKGLFAWIGFKEYIIDYENVTREDGKSSWTLPQLLNYAFDGLLSFNNKPLRASIYIGTTLTAVSVLYVIVMLIQIIFRGVDVPGYFTLISAILLVGGVQLTFLGLIGEYIGRIYYETKKRPHYLVLETNMDRTDSEKHQK